MNRKRKPHAVYGWESTLNNQSDIVTSTARLLLAPLDERSTLAEIGLVRVPSAYRRAMDGGGRVL